MTRSTRFHLDEAPDDSIRHLNKEQFGRRLYSRMLDMGWNQSELARQAGLPRDSISTYVRGKSLPTPLSLKKLADALHTRPEVLLPNSTEQAIDKDSPAMEMKVSTADPTKAWLRVNRMVTLPNAAKIMGILSEDMSGETRPAAKAQVDLERGLVSRAGVDSPAFEEFLKRVTSGDNDDLKQRVKRMTQDARREIDPLIKGTMEVTGLPEEEARAMLRAWEGLDEASPAQDEENQSAPDAG